MTRRFAATRQAAEHVRQPPSPAALVTVSGTSTRMVPALPVEPVDAIMILCAGLQNAARLQEKSLNSKARQCARQLGRSFWCLVSLCWESRFLDERIFVSRCANHKKPLQYRAKNIESSGYTLGSRSLSSVFAARTTCPLFPIYVNATLLDEGSSPI